MLFTRAFTIIAILGIIIGGLEEASAQSAGTYDSNPNYLRRVERYNFPPITYQEISPTNFGKAYAGKQDNEPYEQNTFRMIYAWSFSGEGGIPTNAIVTNVRLIVKGTLTSNATQGTTVIDLAL